MTETTVATPDLDLTRLSNEELQAFSDIVAGITNSGLRSMVDSAFPLHTAPKPVPDCVLIYAGGDTVHPWTTSEIMAMPERYRWPCWVRSNPSQVNALTDARQFVVWLQGHRVPRGTCVILDLETAVNTAYVNTFNLTLRQFGYRVTKYGSQSTIWSNPKTDGGTYLALPGPAELTNEGDEVARQYGFLGDRDLSVLKPQSELPLWDARPTHVRRLVEHVTAGKLSLAGLAAEPDHHETPAQIIYDTAHHASPAEWTQFAIYLDDLLTGQVPTHTVIPPGDHVWVYVD